MKERLRRRSGSGAPQRFDTVLTRYMVLFVIIITAANLWILSREYESDFSEEIRKSRYDTLVQTGLRVEELCNGILTLSNMYAGSDELGTIIEYNGSFLDADQISSFDAGMRKMGSDFKKALGIYKIPYFVVIDCLNGYRYISDNHESDFNFDNFADTDCYAAISENRSDMTACGPYHAAANGTVTDAFILFGRTLYGTYNKPLGYMLICIPESSISSMFGEISSERSVYVTDTEGTILSSSKKELLGESYQELAAGVRAEDYLMTSVEAGSFGLGIKEHISMRELLSPVRQLILNMFVLSAVVLLIMICIVILVSKKFSGQVSELCRKVESIEGDNQDIDFSSEGYYELIQIGTALNNMQSRIKNLIQQVRTQEKEKRISEINFLQAQINPHFIYNTIFSARCLIETGEYEKASCMLVDFISLLRWNFSVGTSMVPLKDALVYLERYINIMKYRFADDMDAEYNIDENTAGAYVINMLFQPVVENAVLHGIAACHKRGLITISVRRGGNYLIAEIGNNGKGMTEEEIRQFQDKLKDSRHPHGMNNIYRQLSTIFRDDFSISVRSGPEDYTVVTIEIPFITSAEAVRGDILYD